LQQSLWLQSWLRSLLRLRYQSLWLQWRLQQWLRLQVELWLQQRLPHLPAGPPVCLPQSLWLQQRLRLWQSGWLRLCGCCPHLCGCCPVLRLRRRSEGRCGWRSGHGSDAAGPGG
jgi:hypothetical protein